MKSPWRDTCLLWGAMEKNLGAANIGLVIYPLHPHLHILYNCILRGQIVFYPSVASSTSPMMLIGASAKRMNDGQACDVVKTWVVP